MPGPYSFPTDRVTGGPSPAADVNALGAALNEASPLATPNVLVERDDNGRFQAEDPVAVEDVATKGWVQTENGLLIPRSIVNAKGDLIVGTADDTVVRLPVGASGTVLKADPGAAEGVSWGSVGVGPYQYLPPVGDTFTSSFIFSTSSVHLRGGSASWMPLMLPETIQFDQVSYRLNVVADAGTVGGLYLGELIGNDFVEMNGGAPIVAGIALDTAAVGVQTHTITPITLQANKVYGFNLRQTTGSGFAVRIASGKAVGPGIESAQGTSWDQSGLSPSFNVGLSQYFPIIKIRRSA